MKNDKILFMPPKSISATDKGKLTKAGYIVIECDDPASIKTIAEIAPINQDILAKAAITAIAGSAYGLVKERFADNISKLLYTEKS